MSTLKLKPSSRTEFSSPLTGRAGQVLPARQFVFIGGTSEPGGLHIHTADVAQALSALGCGVTIICWSVNYFKNLILDRGIAIHTVLGLEEWRSRRWLAAWRELAEICGSADLVFCCGRFGELALVNLMAARLVGRRLYTIVHRPWEDRWHSNLPKKAYGSISGLLVHRSISVSDEISQSAVHDFAFPARKMVTCPNWADPGFCLPSEEERRRAKAALLIPPGTTTLCYLGRLAPEKRVDALIRAFGALQPRADQLLLIAGDGWKRDSLHQLACELDILERVRFTGWVSDPRNLLAACDLFVLPSLVEGFPLALMEAMAMGCPCVAHRMLSTKVLIENGVSGFLGDLSCTESFTSALRHALEQDACTRRAIANKAAFKMAASFSRERRLPTVLAALDCPIAASELPKARKRELSFNSQ